MSGKRTSYATGRRFNPFTDTFDRLYGISVFDQSLTYDMQNRYESDGVYTYYHRFEVTLQPAEKSFTDEQIGEISKGIVAAAEKSGARLRS